MINELAIALPLNLQLFAEAESRGIKGCYFKNCDNKLYYDPYNNTSIKYFEQQENSCANTTIRIPLPIIFSNGIKKLYSNIGLSVLLNW